MRSIINNNKTPAVLVAIAALAAVLVGASAMGSGHMAIAGNVNNTGINVPTDTQQKQECETAGGTSPVDSLMHCRLHRHRYSKRWHYEGEQVTPKRHNSTPTYPPYFFSLSLKATTSW